MKKLFFLVLSIFLVFSAILTFIHSKFGQEKGWALLKDQLERSGIHLKIGTMQGTFPFSIEWTDLSIDTPDFQITIDHLQARLSMIRLIKKEICLEDVVASRVFIQEKNQSTVSPSLEKTAPSFFAFKIGYFSLGSLQINDFFPVSIRGSFSQSREGKIKLKSELKWEDFVIDSTLKISQEKKMELHAYCKSGPLEKLFPFLKDSFATARVQLQGPLFGDWKGTLQGKVNPSVQFSSQLKGEKFSWSLKEFEMTSPWISSQGALELDLATKTMDYDIKGLWQEPLIEGTFKGNASLTQLQGQVSFSSKPQTSAFSSDALRWVLERPWQGASNITWSLDEPLHLSNTTLRSSSVEIASDVFIDSDLMILGTMQMKCPYLQELSSEKTIFGELAATIEWSQEDASQLVLVDGKVIHPSLENISAELCTFQSHIFSPWLNPEIQISSSFNGAHIYGVDIDQCSAHFELSKEESRPFSLQCEGVWQEPFHLSIDGFSHIAAQQLLLDIQQLSGEIWKVPCTLQEPVQISNANDGILISPLKIALGQGRLSFALEQTKNKTVCTAGAVKLPLEFFSWYQRESTLGGLVNFDLAYEEKNQTSLGSIKGTIEALSLQSPDELLIENGSGAFDLALDQERLKGTILLTQEEKPLLQAELSIPLQLSSSRTHLLRSKDINCSCTVDMPLQQVFEYFRLNRHQIKGRCEGTLSCKGTFQDPLLDGKIFLKEGSYHNETTGLMIKNISAEITAEGRKLLTQNIYGEDGNSPGVIRGDGALDFLVFKSFPFSLHLQCDQLMATQLDFLSTLIEADLTLQGNLDKGTTRGTIQVLNAELEIPDKLPVSYPYLQVQYKGKPASVVETVNNQPSYPITFYVDVHVPETLKVSGRGLTSTWKGTLRLFDEYPNFGIDGKLKLAKGSFVLAGKNLHLSEGALFFEGTPQNTPYLNLSASTQFQNISIDARLSGPLKSPQITLHSSPPLPVGSIMSYLLFGEDVSEINGYQALQLTSSIAALSGTTPDVLENIRKTLGVDRLNISTPNQEGEEGQQVTVQVGKYIQDKVLITLSQGAEENSTNISIEVEISKQFSLKLESDQKQQQGKFTLQWNRLY